MTPQQALGIDLPLAPPPVRKKTCLVIFPPLTMPTSPPLGASMLKGFVERELPDWRLKVLDLNVWTFEQCFAGLVNRAAHVEPALFPEGPTAAAGLARAAEAFRGKNDLGFLSSDPTSTTTTASCSCRFTEAFTREIGSQCARAMRKRNAAVAALSGVSST